MHRLESYQRWASVTQGQHKVSAAQVAEQGLKQVETLLKQLHKQAKASLSNDPARASQANQQAQHIQQQLTQLEISYFDKPLLDHQLNLVSSQRPAAKHQFVMRSIDLTSSKSRDEQIQVQANGESTTILLLVIATVAVCKPTGQRVSAIGNRSDGDRCRYTLC